jgi:hypothetical protein
MVDQTRNGITRLVQAIRRAPRPPVSLRVEPIPEPERVVPVSCRGPVFPEGMLADEIRFHQLLGIGEVTMDNLAGRELACTTINRPRLELVADILYAQRWYWREREVADLAATLSLAPNEELTLQISTKRRRSVTEERRLQTELVQNSETSESTKSSTDVTQASKRSSNWSVSTNAELGLIPKLAVNVGASAEFGGAVEATATNSINRVHETTSKSAETLRSLQEVRVEQTVEETIEQAHRRVIRHPYRSRSLIINVFSLVNLYQVTTGFVGLLPALALTFEGLDMNSDFVMANADFLQQVLLDRSLAVELPNALVAARASHRQGGDEINRIVRQAFDLLFDTPTGVFTEDLGDDRFNLDASMNAGFGQWDESGLYDAINNGFGRSFVTIAAVRWLREQDASNPQLDQSERDRRDLELCLNLGDQIKSECTSLSNDQVRNLLDRSDYTEAARRVFPFLARAEAVRELIGQKRTQTMLLDVGTEEETQLPFPISEPNVDQDSLAGDDIISKVVDHHACYRTYYEEAYLRNLFITTEGKSFIQYFRDNVQEALQDALENDEALEALNMSADEVLAALDLNSVYLDGNTWVVQFGPYFDSHDVVPSMAFLGTIAEGLDFDVTFPSGGVPFDPQSSGSLIRVPAQGTYLEAIAGSCYLDGIDDNPQGTFTATIGIDGTD